MRYTDAEERQIQAEQAKLMRKADLIWDTRAVFWYGFVGSTAILGPIHADLTGNPWWLLLLLPAVWEIFWTILAGLSALALKAYFEGVQEAERTAWREQGFIISDNAWKGKGA